MQQQIKISVEEFIGWYTPSPGMALVQKDRPGENIGLIRVAPGARQAGAKYAGSGVIRKLSNADFHENEYYQGLSDRYKEGQRVSFSNTVPHTVSLPAFCMFDKYQEDSLVLIHIADIYGMIDIPAERIEEANGKTCA